MAATDVAEPAMAGADLPLPTGEDVAFFDQHGWWVSRRIIPDDVLDTALAGIERYRAGDRDRWLPEMVDRLDHHSEDGDELKQNGYLSLQMAEVGALVAYPAVAAAAARLLGAPGIRLFHDRLIVKEPDHTNDRTILGWHTDRAYWRTCTSTAMLTAWIPFQDTTAEMGGLAVMDGSHRWTGNEWMATSHDRDLDALERNVSTGGEAVNKVTIELRRGQVSFHDCRIVHGSGPNRSRRTRVALAVHLQSTENRYRPVFQADGRRLGHLNDLLCRLDADGNPDYTDPAIFPPLWPPRMAGITE
jgi:Phytanoyl-CoA dioxygenase (PhyH)